MCTLKTAGLWGNTLSRPPECLLSDALREKDVNEDINVKGLSISHLPCPSPPQCLIELLAAEGAGSRLLWENRALSTWFAYPTQCLQEKLSNVVYEQILDLKEDWQPSPLQMRAGE